eukprot:12047647-Alexandrium_andersonii.AAC.1
MRDEEKGRAKILPHRKKDVRWVGTERTRAREQESKSRRERERARERGGLLTTAGRASAEGKR